MPLFALKAAAIAGALLAGGAVGNSELSSSAHQASTAKVYYTVRSGDTLSRIAGYFCHNPGKYHALARANGIANPNVISVGQHIWLACGGNNSDGGSSQRTSANTSNATITGSNYAAGSANVPATSSVYSYAGLERLWIAAGGSSATAYHAACIAEHESSGRPWVVSPTNDWGLWQIHAGGQVMLIPYDNAQRAVAMSGNGSNWGQWTTARYC
ncbi:MAG TPA: LysM peptidoglycan-binding domain-containing protein [Nitrospiraceae bacterium]|nr:LysM peptidoglycan-binding domain-containing protein [Nitrospiraceae bacterium]